MPNEERLHDNTDVGKLVDALKLIRQTIRNSRKAPNVIDTVDWIAMKSLNEFFKVKPLVVKSPTIGVFSIDNYADMED